jgi:DNA-binding transcriptional ArsR family regulator
MSIPKSAALEKAKFDEDLTYSALANRARRKLLVALASGGAKTADDLRQIGKGRAKYKGGTSHQHLDSTVWHLKQMVDAGMVVQRDNHQDGRKPLYALSPDVKFTLSEGEFVFDFGFWVMRLSADGD